MDRETARKLFEGMGRHNPAFAAPEFLDFLMDIEVNSRRFFTESHRELKTVTPNTFRSISIEGILTNFNASVGKFYLRNMEDSLLSLFGRYSNGAMVRRIRASEGVMQCMHDSPFFYSMLGKIESLRPDGAVMIQPVLTVPNFEKDLTIYRWEDDNILLGDGILGILRAKYLNPLNLEHRKWQNTKQSRQ